MSKGTPKIKLSFSGVKQEEYKRPDATPSHEIEVYWLGVGFLGRMKSIKSKMRPIVKQRRYLMARDARGVRYFNWTEPDRGKEVIRVMNFRKKRKLTKEQAKKHFKKIV